MPDFDPIDQLTPNDRGHLYGDALFETVAVRAGASPFIDRHIARLRRSGLFLRFPPEQIERAAEELRRLSSREDGLWRVTVSRDGGDAPFGGEGAITLRHRPFFEPSAPSLTFVEGSYFPGDRSREHKTSNYLHSILARMTARERGHDDAIMISPDGVVGESPTANLLFVMSDGEVATPAIDGILPGITREVVLERSREEGVVIRERRITRDEVEACEAVILLSSGVGALPARALEGRALSARPEVAASIQRLLSTFWEAR